MATTEQTKQLAPLGYTRLRILSCLGGDMPRLPQYLALAPGQDVFRAFRAFVQRMIQSCAGIDEQPTRALIGAARLLTGDIAGAEEILDHLPATPAKLDHGAGYCLVVPTEALQVALVLPAGLCVKSGLLAGSSEQAAVRAWLEQQRSRLIWDETSGEYNIANASPPAGKQP